MSETGWIGDSVKELISTPNGQIRLLGGVMCVGPAYYILAQDAQVSNFVYAILVLGAIFIALSAAMAVYAAMHKSTVPPAEAPASFEPSDRLQRFTKEVLSSPRSREELSSMTFSGYDQLDKNQLYGLLMQETAKVCVVSDIALLVNGNFLSKSATEETVILQRGANDD